MDALTQALKRLYRLNSAIYTTPESDFVVDPCAIRALAARAYGMDLRWNGTAALWGALDPDSGTLHVYLLACCTHKRSREIRIHNKTIVKLTLPTEPH